METTPSVRVSLLENQPFLRESLSELLKKAGFAVVGEYSEASEFLANVPSDRPHVAIADLRQLSESSHASLKLLKELQQHHPQLRLLVLSEGGKEASELCYREGAAGYLDATAASSQSMIAAINAVARGERLFPLDWMPTPQEASVSAPHSPLVQSLSIRERQVLACVAAGADNLKISALLQISERTVKAHMSKLYQKLGSENRTQLALLALQLGIKPSGEV